jgi:hypothetical protein
MFTLSTPVYNDSADFLYNRTILIEAKNKRELANRLLNERKLRYLLPCFCIYKKCTCKNTNTICDYVREYLTERNILHKFNNVNYFIEKCKRKHKILFKLYKKLNPLIIYNIHKLRKDGEDKIIKVHYKPQIIKLLMEILQKTTSEISRSFDEIGDVKVLKLIGEFD